MKNKDFVDLVRKMREAQKQYFDSRSRYALQIACKLEVEVDNELREFEADRRFYDQLDLFSNAVGR